MSMLVVSAPKNVPMLNYTIDYIINAYARKPEDIVIDHFYFIKGCNNCTHDEMEIAVEELQKIDINASIVEFPPFKWIENNVVYSFEEMYHSLWSEDHRKYRNFHHHKKDNIVNYYFHEGAKMILTNYPETEYIMFFEDDVSIHHDSFIYLKDNIGGKELKEMLYTILYQDK